MTRVGRLGLRRPTLDVWGEGPYEEQLKIAIEKTDAPVELRGYSDQACEGVRQGVLLAAHQQQRGVRPRAGREHGPRLHPDQLRHAVRTGGDHHPRGRRLPGATGRHHRSGHRDPSHRPGQELRARADPRGRVPPRPGVQRRARHREVGRGHGGGARLEASAHDGFTPSLVLPDGALYTLTWSIPRQFGGLTKSLLQRSCQLATASGREVVDHHPRRPAESRRGTRVPARARAAGRRGLDPRTCGRSWGGPTTTSGPTPRSTRPSQGRAPGSRRRRRRDPASRRQRPRPPAVADARRVQRA